MLRCSAVGGGGGGGARGSGGKKKNLDREKIYLYIQRASSSDRVTITHDDTLSKHLSIALLQKNCQRRQRKDVIAAQKRLLSEEAKYRKKLMTPEPRPTNDSKANATKRLPASLANGGS